MAKTSGSKGLQVYVPLNTPVTYDDTKPFAHALAQLLEQREPKLVVSQMAKELRKGKVFIDWSQNDRVKTTVCVYSLRARERPTVSTPLTWDEVEELHEGGDPERFALTADDVLDAGRRDWATSSRRWSSSSSRCPAHRPLECGPPPVRDSSPGCCSPPPSRPGDGGCSGRWAWPCSRTGLRGAAGQGPRSSVGWPRASACTRPGCSG